MTTKKQLKMFNKVFVQMQDAVKVSLKKMNSKTCKAKQIEQLHKFSSDVETHLALYASKDQDFLKKVELLNEFFADKPLLSKANVEAVWKFIHAMNVIAKNSNDTNLVVSNTPNAASLEALVGSLMSDENSGFKNIVEDISLQLEASMKGKDIDQSKVIGDLLAGNLNTSGIDFGEIIKTTTKNLQSKVESGEVDINKLKQTSEQIANITKK
jgi:hypothetical protein